jgi:hypothetical protein
MFAQIAHVVQDVEPKWHGRDWIGHAR